MSERDDVSKAYRSAACAGKISLLLFCAAILLNIATVLISDEYVVTILDCILVIATILYALVYIVNDCFLWYTAEHIRRINAVEDAFSIDITGRIALGYYNNAATDPQIKYVLDLYESCFFSRAILKKMLLPEIGKVVLVLIVLVISLMNANPMICAILAQGVFSTCVLLSSVNKLVCYLRFKQLDDEFYKEIVTHRFNGYGTSRAMLTALAMEYEAIKAHYKVRLSTRIFNKMNPQLSKDWEQLTNKMSPDLFSEPTD